jgi:DNA-binding transcriptional LysR family regulator
MQSAAAAIEKNMIEALPIGELMQYWCAVAVGEELHFTRASRRLHLDQSAVSRHIQKLEAKLGIKLFIRTGHGIELTDAGTSFIPYARKCLMYASSGERFAQAIARGEPRELAIAYSPLIDMHLIAEIRDLVQSGRFSLPVRFQSVAAEKLTQRLFDGASHATIALLPVADEVGQTCIFREKLLVALPAAHSLAQRETIQAPELSGNPMIWALGEQDSTTSKYILDLLRKAGYIPSTTLQAQSVAEALALVREGFGVSLVKGSELQLHPEGLVIRPFSEPHLAVETGLLYLAEHRWPFLAEFVSLVTRHLGCTEHPSSDLLAAPSSRQSDKPDISVRHEER